MANDKFVGDDEEAAAIMRLLDPSITRLDDTGTDFIVGIATGELYTANSFFSECERDEHGWCVGRGTATIKETKLVADDLKAVAEAAGHPRMAGFARSVDDIVGAEAQKLTMEAYKAGDESATESKYTGAAREHVLKAAEAAGVEVREETSERAAEWPETTDEDEADAVSSWFEDTDEGGGQRRLAALDRASETSPELEKLLTFLDRAPDFSGTAYRGMRVDRSTLGRLQPGEPFEVTGLTSFDRSRKGASKYMDYSGEDASGDERVLIKAPLERAKDVKELSFDVDDEKEVLVRKATFKVAKVSRKKDAGGSYTLVELENDKRSDFAKNRSYFADCERDEKGWCVPAGSGPSFASPEEHTATAELARSKVRSSPVPPPEKVAKMRRQLELARQGLIRAGGDARGNSADRKARAKNLFKEFGGEEKGYVVCPWTGLKMHWSSDPDDNPKGYPKFEQGKIFTAHQGGGYQLPNLVPESFAANRSRNDKPMRKENLK